MNKYLWLVLMFTVLSATAEARMFKCTMPDGSVEFSDKKCVSSTKVENIEKATFVTEKSKAARDYSIHQLCAKQYIESDSMRDTCVRLQSEAYADLKRIGHLYSEGSKENEQINKCINGSQRNKSNGDSLINYIEARDCARSSIR